MLNGIKEINLEHNRGQLDYTNDIEKCRRIIELYPPYLIHIYNHVICWTLIITLYALLFMNGELKNI